MARAPVDEGIDEVVHARGDVVLECGHSFRSEQRIEDLAVLHMQRGIDAQRDQRTDVPEVDQSFRREAARIAQCLFDRGPARGDDEAVGRSVHRARLEQRAVLRLGDCEIEQLGQERVGSRCVWFVARGARFRRVHVGLRHSFRPLPAQYSSRNSRFSSLPSSRRGSSRAKVDRTRALVVGEPAPAPRLQDVDEVVAGTDAVDDLDDRLHLFSPFRVGHADDGGVGHGRVRDERPFDFGRVDVDAAADDHVARPVAQEEVAVFIEISDVADREGLPVERRRGGLRIVAILERSARRLEVDVADLASGQVVAVVVDDP